MESEAGIELDVRVGEGGDYLMTTYRSESTLKVRGADADHSVRKSVRHMLRLLGTCFDEKAALFAERKKKRSE